jgi:hypothetical protein
MATAASLALALLAGSAVAGEALKSGPQPGDAVPNPFNPLNVTGKFAGKKQCLVWANGGNPVAMIFARDISDPLTSLVKKIDAATAKHSDCHMGSFVVFLNDEEGLEQKLKELAAKEKLDQTALAIDNTTGPPRYKIAKDADVTVVLYRGSYSKGAVKANYSFRKGELKNEDIDKILGDIVKILPEEKKEK